MIPTKGTWSLSRDIDGAFAAVLRLRATVRTVLHLRNTTACRRPVVWWLRVLPRVEVSDGTPVRDSIATELRTVAPMEASAMIRLTGHDVTTVAFGNKDFAI